MSSALPRTFYERDSREVAPELLNKVLVHGGLSARIVETEAYAGAADPASHAFRGPTRRNATMFGPAGHLYVYFTYGMHWCVNVVCMPEGTASAVLLRAAQPLTGQEEMFRVRRAARKVEDLCSGPAKLAQSFGLTGAQDGADLVARRASASAARTVRIVDDGVDPPAAPGISSRVGVHDSAPWRWWVPGSPHVSRGKGTFVP